MQYWKAPLGKSMESRMQLSSALRTLSVCLVLACASTAAATIEGDIDAIVKNHAEVGIFSGTVLVARNGKPIYAGSAGLANRETKDPNRANTRFNIGSIGKTFTAVAIMQLAEAGKLKLSDPISRFLPDIPYAEKDTITLAHLLSHSAGTGNYMAHKDFRANMGKLRTISAFLPMIYDQPPGFAAGSRFEYSNSGMVLLGAVIEKASGQSYRDYLRDHIFKPAGMQESSLTLEDEALPNRSIGYIRNADDSYTPNVALIFPPSSDGGMRTTVGDMLRFDRALKGTALLSDASKATMWTPVGPAKDYALGWERKSAFGDTVIGHTGGAPGITAVFQRYQASGHTIIVMCNFGLCASDLADKIEAHLYGKPVKPAVKADADVILAFALSQQGDAKGAVRVFDRHPDHPRSVYQGARVRVEGGFEQNKAIAQLDRYLRFDAAEQPLPPAAAWWRKGAAYEQLGDLAKARASYTQSLALDPEFAKAKQALAMLDASKQ